MLGNGDAVLNNTPESGTEEITISNCNFTELGGNALMMMGFNSHNTVADTEFAWLGDSAIALVGRTNVAGGLVSADGTNGDFPADNTITRNHIHEVGALTKQSSPFFQTIACHNNITNNVMCEQKNVYGAPAPIPPLDTAWILSLLV